MNGQPISRRQILKSTGCGFAYLAAAGMSSAATTSSAGKQQQAVPRLANPLLAKQHHHPPRAKRVIFLFMQGGPSHVDSFDYKPILAKKDGEMIEFDDARVLAKTRQIKKQRVFESPWKFRQFGECGQHVSELFPQIAQHVDEFCLVKGMHTEGVAHGPSTLFMHTGSINLIRPSMGSWVLYGLGTENVNLPGFISIQPAMGNGGPRNYSNAFLPAVYQGTAVGRAGGQAKDARIQNLTNKHLTPSQQKAQFDLLRAINAEQMRGKTGDTELEAVINSYELAWRMQHHAPHAMDISQEPEHIKKMYGIGEKGTDGYGQQCLMARRLAEAGVRFIQVNYGDNTNNPRWDQHSNLPKHAEHAFNTDKPVAGLLADLKQRGMLEDTLVWWGGEFGRTPYAQDNGTGRDHNPNGFSVFLAGGGVKPGFSFGETDEFGHHAIKDKTHMHDLHATILHLLGLNHEQLTFMHDGRPFRLTDVHGEVKHQIFA